MHDSNSYVDLTEMAKRLNVGVKRARVATKVPGFPLRDPVYKKWSWAAVVAFNRRRAGLTVEHAEIDDGRDYRRIHP